VQTGGLLFFYAIYYGKKDHSTEGWITAFLCNLLWKKDIAQRGGILFFYIIHDGEKCVYSAM
jgi:hypothetical protein